VRNQLIEYGKHLSLVVERPLSLSTSIVQNNQGAEKTIFVS